jgi:hypothetical protein
MDRLFGEAQGFVRGHDFMGAQARARYARSELEKRTDQASPDPAMEKLRASVELQLQEYDLLAQEWQASNEARHVVFLARERRAIEPPSGTVEP